MVYLFLGNRSHPTPKCINTIGKTHKLRFVVNENFDIKQKKKKKRTISEHTLKECEEAINSS